VTDVTFSPLFTSSKHSLSLFLPPPPNGVRLRNESGGGSRSGATCALASLYNAAVWAAERGSQQSAGYRQQRRLATTDSSGATCMVRLTWLMLATTQPAWWQTGGQWCKDLRGLVLAGRAARG